MTDRPRNQEFSIKNQYAFLFMAMGFQIPFLSLYLKKVLPETEAGLPAVAFIGFVFFIQPFLGIFSNPVMGYLGDRFSIRKRLLLLSGLMVMAAYAIAAIPAATGLSKIIHLTLVGVGMMISGFFLSSIFPLLDAQTLDYLNNSGAEPGLFGRFRMFGTIAYIAGALLLGIFLHFTKRIDAVLWFLAAAFFLFSIFTTRTISGGIKKVDLPLKKLLKDRSFFFFLIYLFLFSFGHNAAYTFTPFFMDDFEVSYLSIGLAFALSAVLEIPVMYKAGNIIKRFGIEKILIIGSLFLIAKLALLYFLAPLKNSYFMIAAMSLHGIGYGLQFNAVIQFVNKSAPKEMRGTYMHTMSVIGLSLPAALSSLFSAYLIKSWGSDVMIGINAVIALSGVIFYGITMMAGNRAGARVEEGRS